MVQSWKMCKISFPVMKQKDSLNVVVKRFFETSFILKSGHFLWQQLQLKMKSWNYAFEFKCLQKH